MPLRGKDTPKDRRAPRPVAFPNIEEEQDQKESKNSLQCTV